jgi:hypothetical protein
VGAVAAWPIWTLALLCAAVNQLVKLGLSSLAQGRLTLSVLGESVGLPSLHAAVMTCLTVLLGQRHGWAAAETSLALVCTAIVVHDAVRFKGSTQEQRTVLYWLLRHLEMEQERAPGAHAFLLRAWAHRPLHVAAGVVFGLVFARLCG